jgi:hypothetical protein
MGGFARASARIRRGLPNRVRLYWPFAKTAFLRLSVDVSIRFKNASNDCKDKSETASLSMKKSAMGPSLAVKL